MKNVLEYKGYLAKIEYSVEDRVLFGKIEGIRDLVNFESESAAEIEKEFQNAVDDYLEFCSMVGKKPDKAYKGTFNVRITPELHKEISLLAIKNGDSLNQAVEKAIRSYVKGVSHTEVSLSLSSLKDLSQMIVSQGTYGINKGNDKISSASVSDFDAFGYGNFVMEYKQ